MTWKSGTPQFLLFFRCAHAQLYLSIYLPTYLPTYLPIYLSLSLSHMHLIYAYQRNAHSSTLGMSRNLEKAETPIQQNQQGCKSKKTGTMWPPLSAVTARGKSSKRPRGTRFIQGCGKKGLM